MLDPLQFAYSLALHCVLQHLEYSDTYACFLFEDYSSAFNTVVPEKLFHKLWTSSIDASLCYRILDFLLCRSQVIRIGDLISDTIALSRGSPQGCCLSPLLYSLYTNGCVSHHDSTKVIKFADDMIVIGLAKDGDESAYWEEAKSLALWSQDNLHLNPTKTREMTLDFHRSKSPMGPFCIDGQGIETVDSFKLLSNTISSDLSWKANTYAIVGIRLASGCISWDNLKSLGWKKMLTGFHCCTKESVIFFHLCVVWRLVSSPTTLSQWSCQDCTADNWL